MSAVKHEFLTPRFRFETRCDDASRAPGLFFLHFLWPEVVVLYVYRTILTVYPLTGDGREGGGKIVFQVFS